MQRIMPRDRQNTFGGPNAPHYDNNYNRDTYQSGRGRNSSGKNNRNRDRSKSRNRRSSQDNWSQNRYQTSPKFQSPKNTQQTQHNTGVISPAPIIICKNNSRVVYMYPFAINDNAGFYADVKAFSGLENTEGVDNSAILNNSPTVRFNLSENNSANESSERSKSVDPAPLILKKTKCLPLTNHSTFQNSTQTYHSDVKNTNITNARDDESAACSSAMHNESISQEEPTSCENSDKNVTKSTDITSEINNTEQSKILSEKPTPHVESCSELEKNKSPLKNNLPEQHKSEQTTNQNPEKENVNEEVEKHEVLQQPTNSFQETCKCSSCDSFIECSAWCNNNLLFAEPKNHLKKGLPLLKNSVMDKIPTISKKLDNKIILQGPIIPKAIFSIDETFMDENIQKTLDRLNCTSAKDIQSYMWPAIQRGLSAFMVGPPKSGKTFAYLPAFCSFCIEKNERYAELAEYEGPLIVILCSTAEECYELQNCAKNFVESQDVTVEVLTDESSAQENCDILIATPSALEDALKASSVKIKRLCHIAIEKGHLLLKNHFQSIQKIFKATNILQTNRPHNKNIQVVVSSEKWSPDLETLLKKLQTTPIVCFEDFLEAAVYSKINFIKKKSKSTYKFFQLYEILKQPYRQLKTVVFCSEDEILKLKEKLETMGVECIAISNNLMEDDLFENEEMWNSLNTEFNVLLCTDSAFEKSKKVSSAQWLVHYHLPTEWSQFQKRYTSLAANISSPFDPEGIKTIIIGEAEYQTKCSFIIIDEFYDDQLFLNFFQMLTRNSTNCLRL